MSAIMVNKNRVVLNARYIRHVRMECNFEGKCYVDINSDTKGGEKLRYWAVFEDAKNDLRIIRDAMNASDE